MVVLGGMGSINGSIIAAALITFINFQLTTKLSGDLAALKFLIYALILISLVILNNAPALAPLKERLSIKKGMKKLGNKIADAIKEKDDPSKIKDDDVAWDRIPSKIDMNALLSTDATPQNNTQKKEED